MPMVVADTHHYSFLSFIREEREKNEFGGLESD
jgi:hypothetical protein